MAPQTHSSMATAKEEPTSEEIRDFNMKFGYLANQVLEGRGFCHVSKMSL